ncbi:MAG: sensor histidine kinase, partial [Bacteroidota bacterium]
ATWITNLKGDYWVPKGEGPAEFKAIQAGGIWLLFFLTIPLIVIIQWFQQNARIDTLERDKAEAELSLLKQQINPHFFFNTLNNLYALSLTKDKQTPEVILQLSELMHYVIYKGKEKEVAIREEVNYIQDYIKLQQIRLHQTLEVDWQLEIKSENLRLPPLLFITLIEIAFKHGIEPAEGPSFLYINLKSDAHSLTFICENSTEDKQKSNDGIGLLNLQRRLALLFPNRHKFDVKQTAETFKVTMSIQF